MKKGTTVTLFTFLLILSAGMLFFGWMTKRIGEMDDGTYETYQRHYVMITEKEDSDFWDKVYESARQEGQKKGAYVERFGEELAVKYDRNELIELAIRAGVDGIIVAGDEEEETIALLDRAVNAQIPVVTVMQDSSGSLRQCYVGANNYNLGRDYAGQIIKILNQKGARMTVTDREGNVSGISAENVPARVLVLTDGNRADTSQNLVLLGIRETLERELGEKHAVTVETAAVDNNRSFRSEEFIRDIFLDQEKLPDILVCLNEVYTTCACQAAVDYNKVGTVQLLGYYDSETILDAVSKNIISATVALDTDQMGRLCVQALDEYMETGYTNNYMAVDTRLITAKDAVRLMGQDREGAEE